MGLLEDLKRGEREAVGDLECPACEFIQAQDDSDVKNALRAALGGTIGVNKLVLILQTYGASFGRRTIYRHRREEHRP